MTTREIYDPHNIGHKKFATFLAIASALQWPLSLIIVSFVSKEDKWHAIDYWLAWFSSLTFIGALICTIGLIVLVGAILFSDPK
jgi:hypothetical protein